jgi:hypothetical protein
MDVATRTLIRQRANDCCEYCGLPQDAVDVTHHVEHVIAKQHGGDDLTENLALACDRCNFHKGPNLTSLDPQTGQTVLLFHPRRDAWDEHFRFEGAFIEGRTPTGRSTVQLLQMNAQHRRMLRAILRATGQM